MKIGYIVGSLSEHSINRRLGAALARLAPAGVEMEEIPIAELPLYNRDFEAEMPAAARQFKERIAASDGLIFITPEHNRTYSAALANALEWGSRPYGKSAFINKPVAVIGASPGALGTAMAQQHLAPILITLRMTVMGHPQAFVTFTPDYLDADGEITNPASKTFLTKWVEIVAEHVSRHSQI